MVVTSRWLTFLEEDGVVASDLDAEDHAPVTATVEMLVYAVVQYNLAASDLDAADPAVVVECVVTTPDLGPYKALLYLFADDLAARSAVETATDERVDLVVDAVVEYDAQYVVEYDVVAHDLDEVVLAAVTATDERVELAVV